MGAVATTTEYTRTREELNGERLASSRRLGRVSLTR